MSETKVFQLESIRTDGWFERVGESIGSFETLCEIVGEFFVAFSLITGARITALTVDRQAPDDSLVNFEVDGETGESHESHCLSLGRFRHRLVNALLTEEEPAPPPQRETDIQSVQLHIGVRYLLLAPLFGYSLEQLQVSPEGSHLLVAQDGRPRRFELIDFRHLLRSHVLEELDRAREAAPERRGGIDLSKIAEAEKAAASGQYEVVLELLGPWAVPLTILLRTPDGQALPLTTRASLSKALGLLGESLRRLGEKEQAEGVLRLAVQYGTGTPQAGLAYAQLGASFMAAKRYGEAIAVLRRAANLGAPAEQVWPELSLAFLERQRFLAAFSAAQEGIRLAGPLPKLQAVKAHAERKLPELERWRALVG